MQNVYKNVDFPLPETPVMADELAERHVNILIHEIMKCRARLLSNPLAGAAFLGIGISFSPRK